MKNIKIIEQNNNGIIAEIPKDIFNPRKTFFCGQCFSWSNVDYQNELSEYIGYVNNSVIGNRTVYDIKYKWNYTDTTAIYLISSYDESGRANTSMTTISKLVDYLDIEEDYSIKVQLNDNYSKRAIVNGLGIRILKQDIFESILTFIISQRNNMQKIRNSVLKLSKAFGTKVVTVNNKEVYLFPTPAQLQNVTIDDYKRLGFGYRAEYLYYFVKDTLNGRNNDLFRGLYKKSYNEILDRLLVIKGVGPKVANCIALFGYHKLEAFPIDIWMQRIIDREYGGYLNPAMFGDKAGVMQQYMFYCEAISG